MMTLSRRSAALGITAALFFAAGCADSEVAPGGTGSGAAGTTGTAGTIGAAGTTGTAGSTGTAGDTGAAGRAGNAGSAGAGGAAGRGGTPGTGGRGGTTGSAGTTGAAGVTGTGGGSAGTGAGGAVTVPGTLDCGPLGWVVENHGPPSNRVNYAILGDGYTAAELVAGGKFEQHINTAMAKRFSPVIGQVYGRYRNFVNICGIKIVSNGKICGGSALGCCGDDDSRLADCTMSSVNAAFNALPASFSLDWRAVMLNGTSWWNTGSTTMMWSGGHGDAPGAALHEGGHGFHQLADEYGSCTGANCGSNTSGTGATGSEYAEVNSTGNPTTTGGKWDLWMGFMQTGATGLQGTWSGSRYVGTGQYRPSANSMMNSLFGSNVNTSFNAVSREQMVMNIWRIVKPIDSTEPAAGSAANPATLKVNVIDPAVINVDWTVDGVTMANAGTTFTTAALAAGTHTISATAYDNAGNDLVRNRTATCPSSVTGSYCARTGWKNSTQTVTWTVTK